MAKVILILLVIVVVLGLWWWYFAGMMGRNQPQLTSEAAIRALELEECRPEGIPEKYGTCEMTITQMNEGWEVVVTYDRFFDDSVKAGRVRAFIRYEDNKWVAREVSETHQCWPGRGHQDFSSELCV